ncbi:hypothetical protein MKEN_01235000 [Mycena kentingensis (nom. inval.)]|nr:hypothetical protein MKEN_01235000 [Mycena kentingensis (nom. inval.)]
MDTLTRRIRGIFASTNAEPPPLPDDGRPEPPASAVQIEDPELISLLSSPEIMNGQDGRRQSVWSMLETSSPAAGSNRSSVMMYSPLIPTSESVIELAEMEIKPRPFDMSGYLQRPNFPSKRLGGATEYISPPPAMQVLDDQSVEAAKQTTIITAALVWFFSNLPIASFPPPLQPAMLLLQRLAPLVSYLGTFISWSWSTIRGFDNGHGVILTATWLLPIALIPSTWHARDFPPPSMPVSPRVHIHPPSSSSPHNYSNPQVPSLFCPRSQNPSQQPQYRHLPRHASRRSRSPSPLSVSTISSTGGPPKTKSKIKTLRRKLTRALT